VRHFEAAITKAKEDWSECELCELDIVAFSVCVGVHSMYACILALLFVARIGRPCLATKYCGLCA